MISASPSRLPERYSWIEPAARRPAPTAWMIVLAPDTTSPPAKTPLRPVAWPASATMPEKPLVSMPAPSGRIEGSGSSPTATRTVVASILSIAAGDRLVDGTAAVEQAGRALADELDGRDAAGRSDDLRDGRLELDVHAFVLGRLDLLDLSRHLGPAAAVQDGDRGRARTERRPCRVHGGAAAADDHDRPTQDRLLAEVDLLEEEGRRHDARQPVARHAELSAARRARRQEDGVVLRPRDRPA